MKKYYIKNIAEINNVKEMTLACTADIDIWTDYLKIYNLVPAKFEGMAKILISVTEMEFIKIRFREFVLSISVDNINKDSNLNASFLIFACNSNKFFSWSERTFFSTPYYYQHISFDPLNFSRAEVIINENQMVSINNSTRNSRLLKFEGYDKWEGCVFLPFNNLKNKKNYKCFYATITGNTKKYEFSRTLDSLLINIEGSKVFQTLAKSNPTGIEWIIRNKAFHSKSKTYTLSI